MIPRALEGKKAVWLTFVGLLISLVSGCDADRPRGLSMRKIELNELPETVREAAEEALPDVKFTAAWKNVSIRDGEIHSYEIRGTNPRHKIREARISPTGEVVEIE